MLPGADVMSLFNDRQGALWIGSSDRGVFRLYDGRLDHFGSENGLLELFNDVSDFFEDREGNLWVATSKGLDRFRR